MQASYESLRTDIFPIATPNNRKGKNAYNLKKNLLMDNYKIMTRYFNILLKSKIKWYAF